MFSGFWNDKDELVWKIKVFWKQTLNFNSVDKMIRVYDLPIGDVTFQRGCFHTPMSTVY